MLIQALTVTFHFKGLTSGLSNFCYDSPIKKRPFLSQKNFKNLVDVIFLRVVSGMSSIFVVEDCHGIVFEF